jgi:hypothetical protein
LKPSTHALRVLLAAFKEHDVRTADELDSIRIEAGCSERSFNAVRAELAKAGTIRRSRDSNGRKPGAGAVTWGIVGENVPPKARRLTERYLRERSDDLTTPPPPPWRTQFRPGSPKYRRAQVAYEQYVGPREGIEREPGANAVDEPGQSGRGAAPGDGWQFPYEPAPRWTGPDIRAINDRFGHGDGSLGVPR